MIEKAKEFAYNAHRRMTDKAGKPYTEHLEAVAALVSTEEEKVVAYLHDTVEDTQVTNEEIRCLFGDVIVEAVAAITHANGEDYMEYIARVKNNRLAKIVKKADLTNNMNITRLPEITAADLARLDKYKKAYAFLLD